MTCAMGPVKYFVARLQEILFKNRFDDSRRRYFRDLPNCMYNSYTERQQQLDTAGA